MTSQLLFYFIDQFLESIDVKIKIRDYCPEVPGFLFVCLKSRLFCEFHMMLVP